MIKPDKVKLSGPEPDYVLDDPVLTLMTKSYKNWLELNRNNQLQITYPPSGTTLLRPSWSITSFPMPMQYDNDNICSLMEKLIIGKMQGRSSILYSI